MKKITVKFFPEITGKIAGVESFKLEQDGGIELCVLVEIEETKAETKKQNVEEVKTESTVSATNPWENIETDGAFKISMKSSKNILCMEEVVHPVLKKNASFASINGEKLVIPNPERLQGKKLTNFLVKELLKVFDGELEEGKSIIGFEPAKYDDAGNGEIQILEKGKIW